MSLFLENYGEIMKKLSEKKKKFEWVNITKN